MGYGKEKMHYILAPFFAFTWIFFLGLRTLVILMGWIVVPFAAACGAYEKSYDEEKAKKKENPDVYHFTWRWMFPWDNFEDGIANDMYWKAPGLFIQIVYWSCLRNPANNLRRVPYLSVMIEKKKVRFVGSLDPRDHAPTDYDKDDLTFWYLCWHGLYSNVRIQFKMAGSIWRFWLGWKIYPEDSVLDVGGHRVGGAGFATQFKEIS